MLQAGFAAATLAETLRQTQELETEWEAPTS